MRVPDKKNIKSTVPEVSGTVLFLSSGFICQKDSANSGSSLKNNVLSSAIS